MQGRVTWVCVVAVILGAGAWISNAQDDFEVPGLGPGGRFNAIILQEEIAIDQLGALRGVPVPAVEEELPDDAKAIVDALDKEAAEIRRKAEKDVHARREKAIKALKELQDKYTRDAKLDEAVAIRDRIRRLGVAHLKPTKNPGNLYAYVNKIDHTFYFDVVGAVNAGSVWGTEVYTCDSSLAAAAVHAGVLKPGQRGIVKVTIIRSPNEHFGSVANGIRSSGWGPFSASYTIEAPEPTDVSTEPEKDR
jgi:hypothetical protein